MEKWAKSNSHPAVRPTSRVDIADILLLAYAEWLRGNRDIRALYVLTFLRAADLAEGAFFTPDNAIEIVGAVDGLIDAESSSVSMQMAKPRVSAKSLLRWVGTLHDELARTPMPSSDNETGIAGLRRVYGEFA